MRTDSGASQSIWMDEGLPQAAPLTGPTRVDACVVGAGLAGLSAARELAREGLSVLVLDDGPIGGGETSRTTAHLTDVIDDRYHELERIHGEDGSRLARESQSAAIDAIEANVRGDSIECGFERIDGYLVRKDQSPEEWERALEKELAASRRAGLAVERVLRAPVPGFDTGPCLRFRAQAQFHPLRYLAGLTGAITHAGGRIHAAHVTGVEDGSPVRVTTDAGHVVEARAAVVATNAPINDRFRPHVKQAAYRTFVVGLRVPAGSIPRFLLWDDGSPYHYVRVVPRDGHDVLLVGGEDHKTGQADDATARHARLEAWTRERFPEAGEVTHRWSGQVMEPVDGLAFLGASPGQEHVFMITGDSGMGMTNCTLGALVARDLIVGRENPWAALYDPSRKSLRAAGDLIRENANVALQYADWLAPGDVGSVDELARGQGGLVREKTSLVAAWKDDGGKLHRFSPKCPHLGCVVAWNGLEKTWDCPCHGSRFAADGHVINGPAVSGLSPAD